MSNDLNQCNFIGRLGKNVELRYTPDQKPIANFSIAVGESWKDKQSGQKQEKATWVNIVIFGALAEIAGKYLSKGSKVFISGKLQTRKWQDQSGVDRYSTEIVIDQFNGTMQMLDAAPQTTSGQQSQNYQQQNNVPQQQVQQNSYQNNQNQAPQQDRQQSQLNNEWDDDIPF